MKWKEVHSAYATQHRLGKGSREFKTEIITTIGVLWLCLQKIFMGYQTAGG